MGGSERNVFSVRIVSIDYYTTPPIPDLDFCYSNFHGGKVNQVPVIRIYGSTPAGQKTCLHVHRILPYLYIPCSDLGLVTNDEAESLKHTICLALEKTLKFKGNAGSKRQHVHGCDLVCAKKFYGYHSSEELFAKIYFYHPPDISRASNLLLAGAVLEKILQPYESHVPFLLQFLIDYNLYGMGHLHVSKVKFRLPVPNVFSQRKLKNYGESRQSTDNSTTMELQADSGGNLCSNVPIWTSSTVPDGWSWPSLYHSSELENPFFRRQSTCELEGDVVVDDIMNQQLIAKASLSQTNSDVKMVQSLVPIWKEEYERSGIFDAMPLDSKKPSPRDVLRILSYGVDFENIVEERDYAEGCSLLTPEIDVGKLTDASFQNIYVLENSEIDAAVTLQIPGSLSPSSAKEPDALRLLKWLASSQAAEDINSDDELARDTILSPLLPSKDINKVLERASVDYESESQKECQDILDSVELQSLEELKTRNSIPSELNDQSTIKLLSTKIIPQLDGSNDDLLLTPCSKSSSETGDWDTVLHEEPSKLPELDSNAAIKHRKKKPGWGPLPLSCKSMDHVINPYEVRYSAQYRNKKKRLADSTVSEEGIVNSDEKYNVNHREEDRAIVECSTRDLMRRKRSQRAELTNCGSPEEDYKAELQSDAQCEKRDQDFDPISENDIPPTEPFVYAVHNSPVENDGMKCDETNMCSAVEMCIKDRNVESISSRKDCILMMNPENLLQVDSVYRETCDASEKAKKDEKTLEVIDMACFKGPPKIDCTDEPYCETPLLQENERNNNFPKQDEPEGSNFEQSVRISKNNVSQTVVYQKDGSCLFMLTPSLSPPSRESVDKWLSFAASGDIVDSENSRELSSRPTQESASSSSEQNDLIQQPEHNEGCSDMGVKPLEETKKNQLAGEYSQDTSQISGPEIRSRQTPLSQTGFRDPASLGQGQQLTLLSIEVQAESRGDLRPDPRFDAVNIIVLVFQEDDESMVDTHVLLCCKCDHVAKDLDAVSGCKIFTCTEELEMFDHFTKVICASDPDSVMGWDVQSGSIGFLAERAAYLGLSLLNNISRTPSKAAVSSGDSRTSDKEMVKEMAPESVVVESVGIETTIIEDEWGRTHASGVHVGGRIVLNVWRLMRNELRLNMYTIEAVAEAVLRRKLPYIPCKVLREWFSSGPGKARYRSIHYTVERAKLNLQIMNKLDMVNRTSELARVFGIDFFSVLSRGSQYRIESMFLRLAHMQSYLAISPGNQQVANQPAMECLPLVMEPESAFYPDPVVVLDFQSLYPSMVIAYNLCYCTCIGNITPSKADTLGVITPYKSDRNILHDLRHQSLVTPNGVVYVPSSVRKGILPRLLEEILSTRIMVKQAMKRLSSSQTVRHRVLNSRQLALKLIANVTYGYTAAGFSGRMPCAELADSIVQCGRRTLETAISFVNTNDKWKARVVYGDTDSMFVLLKGRSLKEAFEVGREIASSITAMNPDPVTLKMEKVYYPCFLLTKKRYVGYSYESADQNKPIFDAKGIETVRRDTCGAVSKIMEQSLRIFFESKNIDEVKTYVVRQWTKILSGRISIQDFVFAKEVRLGTYSEQAHSLPPAAIVATKSMRLDPRAEPRYAERIPYVVVHGKPGARLVDMVVDPHELVSLNSSFRLNDIYYIRKQIIPALQRVFGLIESDLNQWFLEMPKPGREASAKRNALAADGHYKTRIDYYYLSKNCILCGELVEGSNHLCGRCCKNEAVAALVLTGRASKLEREIRHISAICGNCGGGDWIIESGVKCTSLACSVFYERVKVQKELQSVSEVAASLGYYPTCKVEWF